MHRRGRYSRPGGLVEKVSQDLFVSKWQTEAGDSDEDVGVFNYALAEVRWQASHYNGPVRPAAADGTFSKDGVHPSLLRRLLNGADKIRNCSRRDVHPGSNGLVIDLVHPSMYAYEQGVTPVIGDASVFKAPDWDKFVGDGAALPEEGPGAVNARLCSVAGLAWLPSEFEVSADGKTCNINSYINSLHPRVHEDMYTAISDAFVVALPLLEAVLNWIGKGSEPWEFPLRIPNDIVWISEGEDGYVKPEGDTHPLATDSDYDSYRETYTLKMPSVPKEFVAPEMPDAVISLNGKKLQVIVKLSSIELTPEQPRYEGGSWHVEGMRNERIVATACMYLESDNIDESRIEFRTAIHIPEYEQCDDLGVKKVYGLRNEDVLVQPRGASRTITGRALAWPNTLQHRVRPFELEDKTRRVGAPSCVFSSWIPLCEFGRRRLFRRKSMSGLEWKRALSCRRLCRKRCVNWWGLMPGECGLRTRAIVGSGLWTNGGLSSRLPVMLLPRGAMIFMKGFSRFASIELKNSVF